MIDIASLIDSDKSREVRYTAHGSVEYGYITSWNDSNIFVRYHLKVTDDGTRIARYGQTSEATRPEDLEFVT